MNGQISAGQVGGVVGAGFIAGCELVIEAIVEDREIKAAVYEEFKRPEYAPPPLLKRMVVSGRLGGKSGSGFYEYAQALAGATA
jgi:3-hydroxyacyl-CoA dehydrogenase